MSQIPEVPASVPQDQRRFFTELRNSALRQEPNRIPPSGVSNVQATPIGGGNLVTFTRSADAEGYLVRISSTPSWNAAKDLQADVGDSNVYRDETGDAGVTRYYQVVARKGRLYSQPSAPVSATSLTPGTATTIPNPPVSAEVLQSSNETNLPVALKPVSGSLLR